MEPCRFENRLTGRALVLYEPCERIAACRAADLVPAFERIAHAQESGYWVALLLDYELGEWLEPGAFPPADPDLKGADALRDAPRLTALVYRHGANVAIAPACAEPAPIRIETSPRISKTDYIDTIAALRAGIAQGLFYQVNRTFAIDIETSSAPLALYDTIAAQHPTAHASFIQDGDRYVLSFSPELFVSRQGDTLTVRPMKGTAPRHADPTLDFQSGQNLLASEKNRAENLMIVDLLRNDLGRLALPGSVQVTDLFSLERYPSVWTLTSTITATAPGKNLSEILHALFPCGSVTGAPKIAAMRKIKEIEKTPRGIYCGSVGWLAPNGDFSLNVAIRTIEIRGRGSCIFGVGGGIVYDSDPRHEWEECLWKARILDTE